MEILNVESELCKRARCAWDSLQLVDEPRRPEVINRSLEDQSANRASSVAAEAHRYAWVDGERWTAAVIP
jgi:hypothetical protein